MFTDTVSVTASHDGVAGAAAFVVVVVGGSVFFLILLLDIVGLDIVGLVHTTDKCSSSSSSSVKTKHGSTDDDDLMKYFDFLHMMWVDTHALRIY